MVFVIIELRQSSNPRSLCQSSGVSGLLSFLVQNLERVAVHDLKVSLNQATQQEKIAVAASNRVEDCVPGKK